jgi:hypothetical protein
MQSRWSQDQYIKAFKGMRSAIAAASSVPHDKLQAIQSIYQIEGFPGLLHPEEGRLEFDSPLSVQDMAAALGGHYHSSSQRTIDEVVGGDGNGIRLNRLRFDLPEASVYVLCQLVPVVPPPSSGAGSGGVES